MFEVNIGLEHPGGDFYPVDAIVEWLRLGWGGPID